MIRFDLTVTFGRPGYIAHPYWTEMDRLININKESGVNRVRSDSRRRKALEEYFKVHKMTFAEYEALQVAAARPFHTDEQGHIIIPTEKVAAFLVNVADQISAAWRPCPAEQVRSRIEVMPWITEKKEPDGIWERFAVVESGTGQKLSNQRGLRRSPFIRDFQAHGSLMINPEFVKSDVLRRAIEWGGENVGIGASRKMGWGRFTVASWREAGTTRERYRRVPEAAA